MPNNSSKTAREKLYEEYEDILFKLVINDAAEKEGKLFLEENERLKNDSDFQPTKEVYEKFSTLTLTASAFATVVDKRIITIIIAIADLFNNLEMLCRTA